jgi:exopolysaccharide biosynthesis polyprenyl glycosylphosphotransferase
LLSSRVFHSLLNKLDLLKIVINYLSIYRKNEPRETICHLFPIFQLLAISLTQLRKRIGILWIRKIILAFLDSISLFVGCRIPEIYTHTPVFPWEKEQGFVLILPVLAIQISLIAIQGLYKDGENRRNYLSLAQTISFSYFLLLIFDFLYKSGYSLSPSTFISSWLLSTTLACFGRFALDTAVMKLRKQGVITCPTFLICRSEEKEKAIKFLEREKCYNLVGWADVNQISTNKNNLETTLAEINSQDVAEVFVCSWDCIDSRMFLYWQLRNAGIILHILPIELEAMEQKLELKMLGGIPVLNFLPPAITGSDFLIKRGFDFCFAAFFILLASPVYLLIALLIRLDSHGAIFYKQTRIGLHGQPFEVWKFRTMVENADELQKKLEVSNEMKDGVLFKMKDDPRITGIGKFLRKYSLDELPQLFNVLFGEMSLVGPRPLPIRDVEKFSEHHFIREEILPGVTGLWQVSGRSDITDFEKVIRLDVTYMENWSLWLDLQILLQTIKVVFAKEGAY